MSKQEAGIQPESSERFGHFPYLITISGESGAGKTETGGEIARRLGRPYIKGGEIMRADHILRTGSDIIGPTGRDIEEDKLLDSFLAEFIRDASNNKPSIVEARLAALIAKGIVQTRDKDGNPIQVPQTPGIVTVLMKVDDKDVRFKRLKKRINEKKPMTLDEVERQTKEREEQDLGLWTRAHPELAEFNIQDPFDPKLRTPDGRNVYDIVIDSENLSVEEATEELMRGLKNWGEKYLRDKPEDQIMQSDVPYQTLRGNP